MLPIRSKLILLNYPRKPNRWCTYAAEVGGGLREKMPCSGVLLQQLRDRGESVLVLCARLYDTEARCFRGFLPRVLLAPRVPLRRWWTQLFLVWRVQ